MLLAVTLVLSGCDGTTSGKPEISEFYLQYDIVSVDEGQGIGWEVDHADSITIIVLDSNGHTVYERQNLASSSNGLLNIPVRSLQNVANGTYTCHLNATNANGSSSEDREFWVVVTSITYTFSVTVYNPYYGKQNSSWTGFANYPAFYLMGGQGNGDQNQYISTSKYIQPNDYVWSKGLLTAWPDDSCNGAWYIQFQIGTENQTIKRDVTSTWDFTRTTGTIYSTDYWEPCALGSDIVSVSFLVSITFSNSY